MTDAPPYLLLDFRYGWKLDLRSDKVYVAATLWCQRPPSDPKLKAPAPFGAGRFLGLNLFGKRESIQRHLSAMRTSALNSYGDLSNNASKATGVLCAVDACGRPTISWGQHYDPLSSTQSIPYPRMRHQRSHALDKLNPKFQRGYQEEGWSEGDRYAQDARDVMNEVKELCGVQSLDINARHIAQLYATVSSTAPSPPVGTDFLPDPTATPEHHRASEPKPEPRTIKTHRPSRRRIIEL